MDREKIVVFLRYGGLGASSRHRVLKYLPFLRSKGFRFETNCFMADDLLRKKYAGNSLSLLEVMKCYSSRIFFALRNRGDRVFWIQKELLPYCPFWIESLLIGSKTMVFDIDDAVFERYADSKSILVRFFLGRKFDRVFSRADLVIAGNQYLADKAVTAGASRVEVIPTGFEEMDAEIPVKAADSDVPVIVWIGTPSTVGYLELIREALAGVYKKADFLIRVIGAEIDWDEIPVENVPWSADTEMKWLRSASIGVMPLPDQPWEKGKCGFKLIQYMASGLPVVASPVGVNCEIVEPEVTGYLANGSKDWEDSILKLLSSPDLRRELGQRGNAKFRKEYSTSVVEVSLFNSLTSI